jgi:hypothetical protein
MVIPLKVTLGRLVPETGIPVPGPARVDAGGQIFIDVRVGGEILPSQVAGMEAAISSDGCFWVSLSVPAGDTPRLIVGLDEFLAQAGPYVFLRNLRVEADAGGSFALVGDDPPLRADREFKVLNEKKGPAGVYAAKADVYGEEAMFLVRPIFEDSEKDSLCEYAARGIEDSLMAAERQRHATEAGKRAAEDREKILEEAVGAYLSQRVAATKPRPEHCVNWILGQSAYNAGGKCCGYSKTTAISYVRPVLNKICKSHATIVKNAGKTTT